MFCKGFFRHARQLIAVLIEKLIDAGCDFFLRVELDERGMGS